LILRYPNILVPDGLVLENYFLSIMILRKLIFDMIIDFAKLVLEG